jgi:putative flavoprotein involved in K+ transport
VIDSGNYQTALETKQFDWQPMFQSLHPTGVIWSDGQTETVDTVIYATGYRPTYPFLAKLGISEVIHRNGISQQIVGLYFVGLAFQRNHASATLRGAGPDAAHVVRHVEAQLRPSWRYQLWQGINGRFFTPLRQLYCQQFCQSASLK